MISTSFSPGYARTSAGLVHYVEAGEGEPLLLLHQAPGSWDEFRHLMPLLPDRHTIVPDIIGFGASEAIAEHSIERYAESILALIEHLGLAQIDVLGHKLGGIVAVEASATKPELFKRLILSGAPYVDEEYRSRRSELHPLSSVELQDDGRHLAELWVRRSGFYPPARPDLLDRYIRDVLILEDQAEEGHKAISAYRMEGRTTFQGPVLCIAATADPWFDQVERLAAKFLQSETVVIQGGMVPLMEHMPEEVADVVENFLRS